MAIEVNDPELVSTEEAADILGIGLRMFQKIVQGGTVTPYTKNGNQHLFRVFDIQTLKELRAGDIDIYTLIIDARRSAIETRSMRRELDMTKSCLRLNLPVLPTDRDSVVTLTLKADEALQSKTSPTRNELLEWAQTFHGIHESYLEMMTIYVDTKEPWRGFVELGRKLCLSQPAETRIDRELESIYAMLHAGVRILRQAAYFYVRAEHGKMLAGKMFPESKADVHDEVLALSYIVDPG